MKNKFNQTKIEIEIKPPNYKYNTENIRIIVPFTKEIEILEQKKNLFFDTEEEYLKSKNNKNLPNYETTINGYLPYIEIKIMNSTIDETNQQLMTPIKGRKLSFPIFYEKSFWVLKSEFKKFYGNETEIKIPIQLKSTNYQQYFYDQSLYYQIISNNIEERFGDIEKMKKEFEIRNCISSR